MPIKNRTHNQQLHHNSTVYLESLFSDPALFVQILGYGNKKARCRCRACAALYQPEYYLTFADEFETRRLVRLTGSYQTQVLCKDYFIAVAHI